MTDNNSVQNDQKTKALNLTNTAFVLGITGLFLVIPMAFALYFGMKARKAWHAAGENALPGKLKFALGAATVYVILFVVGVAIPETPEMKQARAEAMARQGTETAQSKDTFLSQQNEIEERALKMAKKGIERGKVAGVSLSVMQEGAGRAYCVTVECDAADGMVKSITRSMILEDAFGIIRRLNTDDKLKAVHQYIFRARRPLVDVYGNSSVGVVAEFMLSKEEADKINWKNVSFIQMEGILEQLGNGLWWHPALSE
jgi:hypothetical protein